MAATSDGEERPNAPHGIARDELKAFAERIMRLEEEKKTIADDIKDVYGEAKGRGFDAKLLKKAVALAQQDADDLKNHFAMLDIYLSALGKPDIFG